MLCANATIPLGLLDQAREAFRRGALHEAEEALRRSRALDGGKPAFFNLLGILHECRGNARQAREFYGRALAVDIRYAPAQQNMRRLYELTIFGRTRQP